MISLFNWVDWTIVAVLIYYVIQGWEAGFADLGLSLVGFIISFLLSIKFHAPVGSFLSEKFGIPDLWTTVMGYLIVAFIAQAILSEIIHLALLKIPKKLISSKANQWLGGLVSLFNGFVVISFILLVINALPLRGSVKTDVKNSRIGSMLMSTAQKYGAPVELSINNAKDTVMKFLTVEPDSKESIHLNITPTPADLSIDDVSERAMLKLVNDERLKAGVGPLTVDVHIIVVARAHSRDMFERRYFSHITPEGLSPADRLDNAGVTFIVAGENLAYAPDLATAHTGLMNSPGHRKNILDPDFHHIGIGIITTDKFGMMVTQDFTN
jgi:uncharacterized protein YkwD